MKLNDLNTEQQQAYLSNNLSFSFVQSNCIDSERVMTGIENGVSAEFQIRLSTDFPDRVVAYVIGTDPRTGKTEDGGLLFEITQTDGLHQQGRFFDAADVDSLQARLVQAFGNDITITDQRHLPHVTMGTKEPIEVTLANTSGPLQ
jgi:hypothetical protein